jgi:hypothetical protein
MMLPLWTKVTDGSFCDTAHRIAARAIRSVPNFEIGFTPQEKRDLVAFLRTL